MRYLLLICLLLTSSCDKSPQGHIMTPDDADSPISRDRNAKLQPVIKYVDSFTKDHNRLPTIEEFRVATSNLNEILVLKDRTDKYAVTKGAKTEKDYMVGIWRADWFQYYKSWDQSFLNGSDEQIQ